MNESEPAFVQNVVMAARGTVCPMTDVITGTLAPRCMDKRREVVDHGLGVDTTPTCMHADAHFSTTYLKGNGGGASRATRLHEPRNGTVFHEADFFCTDHHTLRRAPQILGEGLKKVPHVFHEQFWC